MADTRNSLCGILAALMSRRIETGPSLPETLEDSGVTRATFLAGPRNRDLVERGVGGFSSQQTDGYVDRLLKYIPAEIVALYLGVINVIPAPQSDHKTALWVVSTISALCVPLYTYLATQKPNHEALWSQILISSAAFPLWVFAIGGPFEQCKWYVNYRWVAAITICFATFLFGLYMPSPAPITIPSDKPSSALNA